MEHFVCLCEKKKERERERGMDGDKSKRGEEERGRKMVREIWGRKREVREMEGSAETGKKSNYVREEDGD